jgi:hypothetical protein
MVLLAITAPVTTSIPAQTTAREETPCLCGNIVDHAGNAIRDVEMELITGSASAGIRTLTRTAGDGTFSMKRPERGTGELRLRRLGYTPMSLGILFDTLTRSRNVTLRLEMAAVELPAVKVETPVSIYMRGFYERSKQRGTGHFIDRADIEKRRPSYTSDLLRSLPGMSVRTSTRLGGIVRVRGCRPAIFVDGIQAAGAELDDVTRPGDIDGIEVYSSWAAIPPQFNDRQGGKCGAIIVWTRIQ